MAMGTQLPRLHNHLSLPEASFQPNTCSYTTSRASKSHGHFVPAKTIQNFGPSSGDSHAGLRRPVALPGYLLRTLPPTASESVLGDPGGEAGSEPQCPLSHSLKQSGPTFDWLISNCT